MDGISRIVDQWRHQRPDLDPTPLLILGRIQQIAEVIDSALRPPFAAADLGQGDFDLLAALRRAGAPYELTPGQLGQQMLVTSGAVTKRVDRLLARGLVARQASDTDGRGRRIRLTDAGRRLVDTLIERHFANEAVLLSRLDARQVRQLEELLEALAGSIESNRDQVR